MAAQPPPLQRVGPGVRDGIVNASGITSVMARCYRDIDGIKRHVPVEEVHGEELAVSAEVSDVRVSTALMNQRNMNGFFAGMCLLLIRPEHTLRWV